MIQRGQQRAEGGAGVAADLEERLREAVPSARGHARHARGFRMKDRRADADQRGGRRESWRSASARPSSDQAGEREAHADGERVGLRDSGPCRSPTSGCSKEAVNWLVSVIRPIWVKLRVKGGFQQRIDRGQQRLHRVVEQVRKAEREENRQHGVLRRGGEVKASVFVADRGEMRRLGDGSRDFSRRIERLSGCDMVSGFLIGADVKTGYDLTTSQRSFKHKCPN